MGDTVAKTAAAATILEDVTTTQSRAKARGGKWAELADKMLSNAIELNATVAAERQKAEAELRGLVATVDAQDDLADRLIAQISDDVWNKIDRPAYDPTYDVVFPSGINYYTGGPDVDQPERMELLAQLLEMNIITRLSAADATAMAGRLRDMAATYRQALAPTAAPRARLQMFERAATALAHSAQIALAHLKRLYRAEGFTEAEIHTVIPDRHRPTNGTLWNPVRPVGSRLQTMVLSDQRPIPSGLRDHRRRPRHHGPHRNRGPPAALSLREWPAADELVRADQTHL